MNAAQVNSKLPTPLDQDALSALVDGELDAASLQHLLTAFEAQPQAQEQGLRNWHAYHVIGDALRGSGMVLASQRPGDFLAGVRERLRAEQGVRVAQEASVLIPQQAGPARGAAANDAVFRWKMVAGFASLAAVMAVSWSVIGGSSPDAGGRAAGSQLASSQSVPATTVAAQPVTAPSAVPLAASAVPMPSREVVVNTGQGRLIRDARLEELLAEHRQHGGLSALQVPTGFIRGATYEAPGR